MNPYTHTHTHTHTGYTQTHISRNIKRITPFLSLSVVMAWLDAGIAWMWLHTHTRTRHKHLKDTAVAYQSDSSFNSAFIACFVPFLANKLHSKCKRRELWTKLEESVQREQLCSMRSEKQDGLINKTSTRPHICTELFTQYYHSRGNPHEGPDDSETQSSRVSITTV